MLAAHHRATDTRSNALVVDLPSSTPINQTDYRGLSSPMSSSLKVICQFSSFLHRLDVMYILIDEYGVHLWTILEAEG